MTINTRTDNWVWVRRKLHAMAEVSGREEQTAAFVADFLAELEPDELVKGIGGHGLVATFHGREPEAGPTLLFRSELDALPIHESNTFAHRSKKKGVSHKCGHDGHMAILLGFAAKVARERPERGSVQVLFQPAEETGQGARWMLNDPAFADFRPDWVFALHNLPGYPQEQILLCNGTFTASVVSAAIRFQGRTAHAAEPEKGRNPSWAIGHLLKELEEKQIRDDESDRFLLLTPVHLRVSEQPAYGTAPGEGELHLTLRCWTAERMRNTKQWLRKKIEKWSKRYELDFSLDWIEPFAATINDEDAVEQIAQAAEKLGIEVSWMERPFRFGEDFGLFTQKFRGAMFGLGGGLDQPALHHADYDFPDELITPAIAIYETILRQYLG